jgi:hypothetical protein
MPTRLGLLDHAFFALMLVAGIGTALFVTRNPAWTDAGIPPIVWPIGVAFAFDLASVAVRRGGMPPLAMPIRAVGVIGAMALYTLLQGRL